MADINITTDFSEVNNLNNALKSTGDLFTKTVDSLVREEARAKRVTKRLADTTQANLDLITKADVLVAAKVQQESLKREKTRTREAERAEKEANRIVAAAEKIARADAKLAEEVARNQAAAAQRSTAALNQRLGVTGTAATGAGAGFGAIEGEIERLRIKYDQIYASSQLYERSLAELNTAHNLGVMSTKQHEAAVESLNQEYQNFQSGMGQAGNRFAQHVNQTASGMNKMGVAAQQTGYQVSDFIVQVQGGTNPLIAFSQQATQMAGLLYLLPPAIQASTYSILGFSVATSTLFAGVTILIPLLAMLAMAFVGTKKEAEGASPEVKELEDRIRALDSALKEYLLTKQAGTLGITPDELTSTEAMTQATIDLASANAKLAEAKNLALVAVSMGGGAGVFTYTSSKEAEAAIAIADAEAKRAEAIDRINILKQKSLDLTSQEATSMATSYELEYTRLRFGEASIRYKDLEAKLSRDAVENELRAKDIGEVRVATLMQQYDAQQAVLKSLQAQNTTASSLVSSLVKAANVNLASVFSKASPFAQSLLNQVNGLVGAMQNAAAWQMALLPGGSSRTGPDERGSQRGTVMGANTNMPDQPWMSPSKGGGGGGSGGGGGGGDSGLEALLTSLQTEREVIDEWYAESQAILQTASETELQIIGGSNEAKLRLEQEYQDKLKGIREISQNDALGNTATFFGHMATLTASGGDRLAKISKVFAAAEALINTYRAQAQVLADPSLPFLAKFGAVAAIGAAGFGLVNAIKSGGSSSTSKRGSAAVASPSASSPAPQTVFIDSLDPDGLYSGQALINLFDAFYDENDRRGKIFVVGR